jgi:predicted permease
MIYFTLLFFKVLPLYVTIALGYIAGKWLNASRETVANILFYLVTPVVIFNGVMNTRIDPNIIALPFLIYFVCSGISLLFYWLAGFIWKDSLKNLIAYGSGIANAGYFGLPLAILLFDDQGEGTYIMALLGMTFFENTLGYFYVAKGAHTTDEAFKKLLKLPTLYAFILALALNLSGVELPKLFVEYAQYMKGTYTVLGMMVVGLGLSTLRHLNFDYKFISITFFAKFFVWPVVIFSLIALDTTYFHFFDQSIYNALVLLSIVPLGANMVVFATIFKNNPEKTATAVLLGTIFALIYVPLMTSLFISVDPAVLEENT